VISVHRPTLGALISPDPISAVVAGSQGDLSCRQLKHKQVVYKPKWDDGVRVARACSRDVL